MGENNGFFENLIEGYHKLVGTPIKSSGRSNVIITRDKNGKWLANGRPMADGYKYYEKGNTYVIRGGKRYLISQTKEAAKQSEEWKKKMNTRTNNYKTWDEKIARMPSYGWDTENETLGGLSRRRLKRNVDPGVRQDATGAGENVLPWTTNEGAWDDVEMKASPDEKNIWWRHLGWPRDSNSMPATGIRFMGDFNNDGSARKPIAEYSGFTNAAKETIKKDIADGHIKVDPTGAWTAVEESPFYSRRNTAQYANYSIRENNNSGIYDVFDTYDFENSWYYPNLNRPYKKQIEFRDTIHGPNADDRLYNPTFRSPKKND